MKSVLVVLVSLGGILFVSLNSSFAHEGHNSTPGSVQAPHGGVVKGTKSLYVELVNEAAGIKLYPLTLDLKPIELAQLKMNGSFQVPKKKKTPVPLQAAGDHYSAQINAKGAYRYTLELNISYKGKSEKLLFQVEPQS